ncbi:MAG: hypothetical protein ACTSVL_03885 [Promethearchaeota archaeon]
MGNYQIPGIKRYLVFLVYSIYPGNSLFNVLSSRVNSYSVHGYDECAPPQSKLSFEDDRRQIMNNAIKNVKIIKREQPKNFTQPKNAGITIYKYGIIHNVAFGPNDHTWLSNKYFRWIFDIKGIMENCDQIYDVFYRDDPSESLIKSDLQYYNKDIITNGHGTIKDILFYTIYAHGINTNTWWTMEGYHKFLEPREIRQLWYHSSSMGTEIDVNADSMIILAKSCWGLGVITHTMANAFVVYGGAKAFVGNKREDRASQFMDIGDINDPGFWRTLCIEGGTLEEARNNLVDHYNQIRKWNQPKWSYSTIGIIGDSQVSF